MLVTSGDDTVPAMGRAALLDLKHAAQTECASITNCVQVLDKFRGVWYFLYSFLVSDDLRFWSILKKIEKCGWDSKTSLNIRITKRHFVGQYLVFRIWKNLSLGAEKDGWKSVTKEKMSLIPNSKRKKVDKLPNIDAQEIGVASRVLLNLSNLCAKEAMQLETFTTNPFCSY